MRISVTVLALGLLILWSIAASAEEFEIEKEPGYVDLDLIEIPQDSEEIVDINLGPSMLRIASQTGRNGDAKLSQILSQIYSIRVKSFNLPEGQSKRLQSHIREIDEKLNRDDWERVIRMVDRDEFVTVRVLPDEEGIAGLVVMALEPGEKAFFANIVGRIDLAMLASLAFNLGLSQIPLDDLIEEMEKNNSH
jgi:hypothetical protein